MWLFIDAFLGNHFSNLFLKFSIIQSYTHCIYKCIHSIRLKTTRTLLISRSLDSTSLFTSILTQRGVESTQVRLDLDDLREMNRYNHDTPVKVTVIIQLRRQLLISSHFRIRNVYVNS